MTPVPNISDPAGPRPFLQERFPDLVRELEHLLRAENEHFLANSVEFLQIYEPCECSDTFCASFYTGPRPDGEWGQGHRSILLNPTEGMTILDVVDDVIRYIELIDRPDIHEALRSGSALSAKPLLLLDIDGVLSPFGGGLTPGFIR